MEEVLISIVIPVKNGDVWLDDLIRGIMSQTLFPQSEIIVLDSGSSDNSLEILKKYPVSLYSVKPEHFNHGLTRNEALKYCKGKYIVMTVQDAKPVDELWLQHLLDGFDKDTNVAGVCGQQIVPHDADKNPAEWFRPVSDPGLKILSFSPDEYHSLSPQQKKDCCSWDNVTAMYDRKILENIPFVKIPYGEDAVWAHQVLSFGYTLVYNQSARVYHYHSQDASYIFRRTITSMYLRYRAFNFLGTRPRQSIIDKFRLIRVIWKSRPVSLINKVYWYRYNVQLHKGLKRGYDAFINAMEQGDEALEQLHEKYCGTPPVPLKTIRK